MAQAIETAETVSTASGAEDTFPTVWTFEHAEEVRVLVRVEAASVEQTLGVHFDLSDGDWLTNGADVVFRTGHRPPPGAVVARQRQSLQRQQEPFGDQERFRPRASEAAYDRLTRMAQDIHAATARTLTVPVGEAGVEVPPAALRAGKLAWFNGGAIAAFLLAPGMVLGAHPDTGALIGLPPAFAVDAAVASVPSRLTAALTRFPASLGFVRTAGYDAAGDGGEGLYARVEAEPDHFGKFQDAAGAWFEYVPSSDGVNARVMGAGLGAADDTAALASALAFARARKAQLNLGGAEYSISDEIALAGGEDICGGHLFARIIQTTAGKGVFRGLNKDDIRVRDLILEGPGSQHLIGGSDIKAAIVIQGGENARVENVHISGFYNGVNIADGSNKRVSGCVITAFRLYGVVASLCDGFRVQTCTIGGCTQTGAANGYCVSATGDVAGGNPQNDNFITDNLLYGVPCWDAVMTHEVRRLQARGNIIKDVRVGFDISAASSANPLFDIAVVGNIIELTATNTWGTTGAQHAGVYVGGVPGAYIDGVVVALNIIVGANKIPIPGGSIGGNLPAAIQLQYVKNATVADNVARDLGNVAPYNVVSIFMPGDNVSARGNTASGALATGYMLRVQGGSLADVAKNLSVQNNVTTCPVIAHTLVQNLTATRMTFTGNSAAGLAPLLSTSGADISWQNGFGSFTPTLKIGGVALGAGSYTTRLGEFDVRDGLLTASLTIIISSREGKTGAVTIDGLPMPTRPGADGMSYPFTVSCPTGVSGVPMATLAAGGSSTLSLRNNATDTNLTEAHMTDAARFVLQGSYRVAA